MPNEFFKQMVLDLTRKGAVEKVRFLKNLHKKVMPSQFEKIQRNDKKVMQELFLPKWLSWELLRAWADNVTPIGKGRACALCDLKSDLGIMFNEKFVCENCFIRLHQLK